MFPQSVEEVEWLTRLAARHSIPLVARGAGTALYPGKPPRGLVVRFDAMHRIRLPEGDENWAEVEPGATWWALAGRLGERGMGPTVYPTSAPRSTVGGWLAENGIGVGSYEYGWLLQNVLSVEAVLAGGERSIIEGGEALRHFVGSRGSMGFVVKACLATRRAGGDVPVAVLFRDTQDLAKAILDLDRGGAPLWHLGLLNAAMARAKRFEVGSVLFGAYPKERKAWVESALQRVAETYRGEKLPRKEAQRVWEQRFFPASHLGPTPRPGRAFVRGERLSQTLPEIERRFTGVAIQGSVSRWGEVALLAFDPAEGGAGVVDLSSVTDAELVRLAGRSWMPEHR
ncbi:MAG TPA: FAD-binding oxidoreductase [Rubrobacter sp.]|nr:FAD-binding oxidoreductase [Rubrobacter sp.]